MLKKVFLFFIIFYRRYISQYLPKSCIYHPTCSKYAYISIERFGILKGLYLATKRVLRCTPFHKGGYDPVPNNQESKKEDK